MEGEGQGGWPSQILDLGIKDFCKTQELELPLLSFVNPWSEDMQASAADET